MNTNIENNRNTIIREQVVNGHGKIINASTVNSNYFDDPLKFCCEKKINEHQDKKKFTNIQNIFRNILDKDGLKRRFGGTLYKYELLLDYFDKEHLDIDGQFLDDGFGSVIKCIYKVTSYFHFCDNHIYVYYNNEVSKLIDIKIASSGLMLRYTEQVKEYETYLLAKNIAEKIVEGCTPYIMCAAQYGNFFQFSHIGIEPLKNVPFITQEVRFKVSNDIIPNLIRPLYGNNPECGLREIIQNALDALKEYFKTSRDKCDSISNPLEICLLNDDINRKKIIVRDYGIGMTQEVLLEKYFVIGESTKKNNDLFLVGQFGIGALAAFLLGDKIEVRTKHYKEAVEYHFSYHLPKEMDKGKNSNIGVSICKDSPFVHGTEVIIELNDTLSKLNEEELQRKLKLNEWYVMTDFPITYKGLKETTILKSYKGSNYQWKKLNYNENSNVTIEYCKEYPEENNLAFSKIIFNGLMLPEGYHLNDGNRNTNDCIKFFPCISIYANNQDIRLNLERTKIETGLAPICQTLKHEIINLGIEELKKQISLILDKDGNILKSSYTNRYIKNIPLFFTKNGFGIYTSTSIQNLGRKYPNLNIVEIYGNISHKIKIHDLNENAVYLFFPSIYNRTQASNLIECTNAEKYISKETITKYFINGLNKYYGLRKNSMYQLYECLQIPIESDLPVEKLWDWHNENKLQIEKIITNVPNNYLVMNPQNNYFDPIMKKYHPDFILTFQYPFLDTNRILYENIDIGIVTMESFKNH